MSGGGERRNHQAGVLCTSADFHAKGGKLINLGFLVSGGSLRAHKSEAETARLSFDGRANFGRSGYGRFQRGIGFDDIQNFSRHFLVDVGRFPNLDGVADEQF
jgi:hypothetical protein